MEKDREGCRKQKENEWVFGRWENERKFWGNKKKKKKNLTENLTDLKETACGEPSQHFGNPVPVPADYHEVEREGKRSERIWSFFTTSEAESPRVLGEEPDRVSYWATSRILGRSSCSESSMGPIRLIMLFYLGPYLFGRSKLNNTEGTFFIHSQINFIDTFKLCIIIKILSISILILNFILVF